MARRGVFELRQVLLRYELAGGSSAGVRSFVEADLIPWARDHPFVRVETQVHRGHPNVIGQYGRLAKQGVRGVSDATASSAGGASSAYIGRVGLSRSVV